MQLPCSQSQEFCILKRKQKCVINFCEIQKYTCVTVSLLLRWLLIAKVRKYLKIWPTPKFELYLVRQLLLPHILISLLVTNWINYFNIQKLLSLQTFQCFTTYSCCWEKIKFIDSSLVMKHDKSLLFYMILKLIQHVQKILYFQTVVIVTISPITISFFNSLHYREIAASFIMLFKFKWKQVYSNYRIGSAFGESSSLFTAELLNSHFHPKGFDVLKTIGSK